MKKLWQEKIFYIYIYIYILNITFYYLKYLINCLIFFEVIFDNVIIIKITLLKYKYYFNILCIKLYCILLFINIHILSVY